MSTKYTKTVTLSAADGSVNVVFRNLYKYDSVKVSVSWTGLDAVDGTMKLQEDDGNSGFVDIPTLSETLAAASGNVAFQHRDFGGGQVRLVYDVGTATAGSLTVFLTAKIQ